jgi:hypothetical protein
LSITVSSRSSALIVGRSTRKVGSLPETRRVIVGDATSDAPPPDLSVSLAVANRRLDKLEDEAAIVNLQHRYGYYLDLRDWDSLVELFAEQGSFEPGLQGVYVGRVSIRRALAQFGSLTEGEIDDHILLQTYVSVATDGASAKARVDQLGLQGRPGGSAQWTQGIYENTFIKENGEWRIQSLHYYPRLITDYAKGWGVQFRDVPHKVFPDEAIDNWRQNRLIISIQPEMSIRLQVQAKRPGLDMVLNTVDMVFNYDDSYDNESPEAYETLLLDVMIGDQTLFMRGDQVEAAWEVLMPILTSWESKPSLEFPNYSADSWGPELAEALIARDGFHWFSLPHKAKTS